MRLIICQVSGGCLPAILDAEPWELATIKRLAAAAGMEVVGSPCLDAAARKALRDVAGIRTLDEPVVIEPLFPPPIPSPAKLTSG